MGRRSLSGRRTDASFTMDTLEWLIMENTELRQTVAELALQTAILRESLDDAKLIRLRLGTVAESVRESDVVA